MTKQCRIALVAHDNKKGDLLEWARYNRELLAQHRLYATGTTGRVLEEALEIEISKLIIATTVSNSISVKPRVTCRVGERNITVTPLEYRQQLASRCQVHGVAWPRKRGHDNRLQSVAMIIACMPTLPWAYHPEWEASAGRWQSHLASVQW